MINFEKKRRNGNDTVESLVKAGNTLRQSLQAMVISVPVSVHGIKFYKFRG